MGFNAPKNRYNSFGDYYYRSAEDMEAALKPLLDANNLTMIIDDEVVEIGGRFYDKATVTIRQGDAVVFGRGFAREVESRTKTDPAQITGMASSYARKYALGGLFLVDDQQDADAQDNSRQEQSDSVHYDHELKVAKERMWEAVGKSKEIADLLTGVEHPETPEWYDAVGMLWVVICKYQQKHGGDAKELFNCVRQRKEYQETAAFYVMVRQEFESEIS